MTQPKSTVKQAVGKIAPGKEYPGVHGKVVDWAEHTFEEGGLLFIRVRFTDKTELCWTVKTGIVIEEADLSDWSGGNFKQKRVYIQSPERREIAKQDKVFNRICARLDKANARAARKG